MKLTESHITDLLAQRHAKDVFVPQCKTGPSMAGVGILDAWAMRRSWTNPCCTGYEIKVSRSDFLADTKWRGYLKYCHEFYWVAPKGVILPSECEHGTGLLVVSDSGNLLIKKRPAIYYPTRIDPMLYLYILMCRCEVRAPQGEIPSLEYWREWLAIRNTKKQIGRRVSKALAWKYAREVELVNRNNIALRAEVARLRDVIERHCRSM